MFSAYFLTIFKILPCTLTIKVRGLFFFNEQALKSRIRIYIWLPYHNSKGKSYGGGGKHRFAVNLRLNNSLLQVKKNVFEKHRFGIDSSLNSEFSNPEIVKFSLLVLYQTI